MQSPLGSVGLALISILETALVAAVEPVRPLQLLGSQQVGPSQPRQTHAACSTGDGGVVIAAGKAITKLNGPLDAPELSVAWEVMLTNFLAYSVKELPNRDLICAGEDTEGDPRVGLLWMSPQGTVLKRTSFGGVPILQPSGLPGADRAYDLQVLPGRDLLLTGTTSTNPGKEKQSPLYGNLDGWALLVGSDGSLKWERALGGARNDTLTRGVQTADGGFIFAGRSDSQGSAGQAAQFWLVKTTREGNHAWERYFDLGYPDTPPTMIRTASGGVILGGSSQAWPVGVQHALVLCISDEGTPLWRKTIKPANLAPSRVLSLAELQNGKILAQVLQFNSSSSRKPEIVIKCFAPDGADLWQVQHEAVGQYSGAVLVGTTGEIVSLTPHPQGSYRCARFAPESVLNAGTIARLFALPEYLHGVNGAATFSLLGPTNVPIYISQSTDLHSWQRTATNILGDRDFKFHVPKTGSPNAVFFRATLGD